ncbi:unnamed protein product [Linum tenue]|uniref:CCHC-type domain-containing protein n=1 Tax=Linum tenue TaxID=586396 RepID=A0AAV0QPN1_9ROSI|nr:unnamed protein product [Linum tenue]
MVTKRQKLARRKFKQENPALFPKPEPTPPKDPNKPKKKKSLFKRKKKNTEPRDPSKRSKFTKRPLRVPGMKPGDTCYICKSVDHIAKLCPQKAEWERNKICLLCRQRGHSLQRCPNKEDETVGAKLCYNCGESGHSLANCLQPRQDGGTKFANCFICNEQGHLSKDCPKNAHGIYPKGGCCKICSGVTHLARDCPDKDQWFTPANDRQAFRNVERPTGKLIKFISGDELADDFMLDSSAYSSEQTGKSSDTKEEATKSKMKKEPKVVNFEG